MIQSVLIDSRTSQDVIDGVKAELAACEVFGLDCETQDENRHAGLNLYNTKVRHVFDHRRTVMTGFSTYVEGSDTPCYRQRYPWGGKRGSHLRCTQCAVRVGYVQAVPRP